MRSDRVVVGVDDTVESKCAVGWCAANLGMTADHPDPPPDASEIRDDAKVLGDRRRSLRRSLHLRAEVAVRAEARLPPASTIDVSVHGLLLAFVQPVGFPVGQRLCVSLDVGDGRCHLLVRVCRIEHGLDFRTYVGVEFLHPLTEERCHEDKLKAGLTEAQVPPQ